MGNSKVAELTTEIAISDTSRHNSLIMKYFHNILYIFQNLTK